MISDGIPDHGQPETDTAATHNFLGRKRFEVKVDLGGVMPGARIADDDLGAGPLRQDLSFEWGGTRHPCFQWPLRRS